MIKTRENRPVRRPFIAGTMESHGTNSRGWVMSDMANIIALFKTYMPTSSYLLAKSGGNADAREKQILGAMRKIVYLLNETIDESPNELTDAEFHLRKRICILLSKKQKAPEENRVLNGGILPDSKYYSGFNEALYQAISEIEKTSNI